jgi:hypothetical protein
MFDMGIMALRPSSLVSALLITYNIETVSDECKACV